MPNEELHDGTAGGDQDGTPDPVADLARTWQVASKGYARKARALESENRILQANATALESVLTTLREGMGAAPGAPIPGLGKRVASGSFPAGDIRSLRVLGVMDEFTASAFQHSCNLLQPPLTDWQEEADAFAPDLLIVESAWQGNGGRWHQKIDRMSSELLDVIAWCRDRQIPTVFWNKEDPVHYNGFISVATLFDYVFTTDMESIRRYKRELGHPRVYLMPFFCEPELHDPLDADRAPGFSFAGAYYRRYQERQADFDAVMGGIEGLGKVSIFDRNHNNDAPEFDFPEKYRPFIAGGLKYSDIALSYKGAEFGINMNSVKQSQSMFARRVFDLILCDTHVVSNYSRGLRLMFGDLVVSSDSPDQTRERVVELLGKDGDSRKNPYAAYIRLLALRKVLTEHTTQERLAYMASRIWVDAPARLSPAVCVVAEIGDPDELDSVLEQFRNQTWAAKELVLVVDGNSKMVLPLRAEGIRYRVRSEEDLDLRELTSAAFVAVWDPRAGYGRHYLQDALRTVDFNGVDAVARVPDSGDPLGLGNAFQRTGSAPVSASVWRIAAMPVVKAGPDREALHHGRIAGLPLVTLPSFDYARTSGELADTTHWDAVTDTGVHLAALLQAAEALEEERSTTGFEPGMGAKELFSEFPQSQRRGVAIGHSADSVLVSSDLAAGDHQYLYARNRIPLANIVGDGSKAFIHAVARPGLALSLVVLFLNSDGTRIGSQVLPVNCNVALAPPALTALVHLGLRVQGPGSAGVYGISFGAVEKINASVGLLSDKPQLLITNVYPSYADLYRNGFVHSRVRSYREAGLRTSVFVLNTRLKPGTYEFEGVEVQVGDHADLAASLKTNSFENVLVHFLDENMWRVLEKFVEILPVTVWIHGAEIQPWYRRDFNFTSEQERNAAKKLSATRMDFWREVFSCSHPNLHFVLVSRYFADEVMTDVGIRLKPHRYSVIHNFVDTDLFSYKEKSPEQRLRILSIRPFASRKYANDLTVGAILALRDHPMFQSASFLIVGDGILFDQVLEPLRGLPNVEIRRQFLAQSEIAGLHEEFGVFMSPTRMDSQGVSRDEAMSSGLVPVTTAVTAIPEFVDPSCCILAPGEDAAAMAAGIAALWEDPAAFEEMSAAAARRVTRQSGRPQTIDAEIALIKSRSRK